LPAGVGPGLGALACSAATSCNLGGTVKEKSCFQAAVVSHTDDGGKTWVKLLDVCAAGISALACPTSRTCYAGGSYGMFGTPGNELVLHTDDAGASWDDQFLGAVSGLQDPTNPVSYAIIGIACPSAQICFLPLGHAMLATRNGGTRWTVQTSSTGAFLPAISCPTTRMCVAVGVAQPANQGPGPQQVNGVILRTLNGGATWTRP
jgi:photosystem II stability/assembly factor-like uncharacterized protein